VAWLSSELRALIAAFNGFSESIERMPLSLTVRARLDQLAATV